MSKSRLLPSQYSDDEEFTLHAVHESLQDSNHDNIDNSGSERYLSNSYNNRPYFQTTDSSDDDDMEAPASLILDRNSIQQQHQQHQQQQQQQQRQRPILPTTTTSTREHVTTYDRTMWRWTNVENMDDFFNRVYEYFQGKGIYCILLARLLNLL